MSSGLGLLQYLEEEDLDWVFTVGQQVSLDTGETLVDEGSDADALFIIMQGVVSVVMAELGNQTIATLGAGKVVGEFSYFDRRPRSATVVAVEGTIALRISFDELDRRCEENPRFAATWFRSLAQLMVQDVRSKANPLAQHEGLITQTNAWQKMHDAVDQLKKALATVDSEALSHGGQPSDEAVEQVDTRFKHLVSQCDAYLGSSAPLAEEICEALGRRLLEELLPLVLLTRTARRLYEKPSGRTEDFETLRQIYANEAEGAGRVGPLLDRCFLDTAPARAVRNRRDLVAQLLAMFVQDHVDAGQTAPLQVASLGCGPADEIFDAFGQLEDRSQLLVHAVDFDLRALTYVSDRRTALQLDSQIELHNVNLPNLALGRGSWHVGGLDVVYSMGLIGYLDDQTVIKLLNFIHGILAPGGRLLLGSFHPRNPLRPVMDHVLGWRLSYRGDNALNRLLAASSFGAPAEDICYEDEGVQLFALAVKS